MPFYLSHRPIRSASAAAGSLPTADTVCTPGGPNQPLALREPPLMNSISKSILPRLQTTLDASNKLEEQC